MEISLDKLDISIRSEEITGIYIDKEDLIKEAIDTKKYNVSYIDNSTFYTKKVSDEFFLVKNDIDDKKNYIEKIISCLKLLGLTKDYLDRDIDSLSKTERLLINISLNLIKNKDIIIFSHIFKDLDKNNKEVIKRLIIDLKNKYNKIIIIIDDNMNILYDICTWFIIVKDNKTIINIDKKELSNNIDSLIKNNIELPFIVEFSKIACNYDKTILNQFDINSLIKEVYKNVK